MVLPSRIAVLSTDWHPIPGLRHHLTGNSLLQTVGRPRYRLNTPLLLRHYTVAVHHAILIGVVPIVRVPDTIQRIRHRLDTPLLWHTSVVTSVHHVLLRHSPTVAAVHHALLRHAPAVASVHHVLLRHITAVAAVHHVRLVANLVVVVHWLRAVGHSIE